MYRTMLRCLLVLGAPLFGWAAPAGYMDSWGPWVRDRVQRQIHADTLEYAAAAGIGLQGRELLQESSYPASCGAENPSTQAGRMWFTAMGCRIASTDLVYVNKAGELVSAKQGGMIDPISSPGESVNFPPPAIPDCYMNGKSLCGADEFCMAQRHEKWGPWAQAPGGLQADRNCAKPYYGYDTTGLDTASLTSLNASIVDAVCGGVYCENGLCGNFSGQVNQVSWLGGGPSPWRPIQGQCVKYRQKGQSCYLVLEENPYYRAAFVGAQDASFNEGGGLERPYVCAPGLRCADIGNGVQTCVDGDSPNASIDASDDVQEWFTCSDDLGLRCGDGLVCTGDTLHVINTTCVTPRPRDVCFAGPWWVSTYCPRTNKDGLGNQPPCGGMTRDFAVSSLYTTMLLSPGEYVSAGSCKYWHEQEVYVPANDTSGWPMRMQQLRRDIHAIFDTLWPRHLIGFEDGPPSFDSIEAWYEIPTRSNAECLAAAQAQGCGELSEEALDEDCRLQRKLSTVGRIINEPNKVWSLIHWSMANLKDPMTPEQVQASKAIALILRDNFWCNDCRGFFDNGVLGVFGYPPSSTKAEDHARYWSTGHNEASEHVATTRGSHPWIYQLANQSVGSNTGTAYQNPFYMPFEDALMQWKQVERDPDGNCPSLQRTDRAASAAGDLEASLIAICALIALVL